MFTRPLVMGILQILFVTDHEPSGSPLQSQVLITPSVVDLMFTDEPSDSRSLVKKSIESLIGYCLMIV